MVCFYLAYHSWLLPQYQAACHTSRCGEIIQQGNLSSFLRRNRNSEVLLFPTGSRACWYTKVTRQGDHRKPNRLTLILDNFLFMSPSVCYFISLSFYFYKTFYINININRVSIFTKDI